MAIRKFALCACGLAIMLFCACAGTLNDRNHRLYDGEEFTNADANFLDIFYDPPAHIGERVTWGGEIINFAKVGNEVELTMRQIRLEPRGWWWRTKYSNGRFIIRTRSKLDQSMYRIHTFLIVKGSVSGSETKPVGKRSYTYPLINPAEMHFWQPDPTGNLQHCWNSMGWQGPYEWKCDGGEVK